MKNLKVKTKLFLKSIFNKLGFQILRLPYQGKASTELIKVKVGQYDILLNGSHQLPMYMRNPNYSTNLPRLAVKVKKKYSDLVMIDVGANVGDTVAFVRSKAYFPIVCIEGDSDFYRILKINLKGFKDVYAFQNILGEESGQVAGKLVKDEGVLETARIRNSGFMPGGNPLKVITLDDFLNQKSQFRKAKLLKTDTDGYDLKIIRGALGYIKETKPVLFFEYDTVFLAEQKDDGISTLKKLESLGYCIAVFYDNSGRFLLSVDLSNHLLIQQMHNLIDKNYRTPFPFYDIALFHEEDKDLAGAFVEDEMSLFQQS